MNKMKQKIIRYSLKKRRLPDQNRRQVAKNLSLLSIVIFLVFLINFAIIIGTDSKFGKNLSELSHQVHQKQKSFQLSVERFMTGMEQSSPKMRRPIMYMLSLIKHTNQPRVKFFM